MQGGLHYCGAVTNEKSSSEATSPLGEAGWRRFATIIVGLLFVAVLGAANPALWFATSLSSTDAFVGTFAPLPTDERVAAALADRFANSVYENNDIAAAVSEPLPDALAFIAAPLAEGVRGLIETTAMSVIQSEDFARLWEGVLRVSHGTALWVVDRDDEGAVQVDDGAVILDLSELLVAVEDRLERLSFNVLADRAEGVTIAIYHTDGEGFIATLIRAINAIRWISPILTVLLAAAAIFLAADRRKMALWLGLGTTAVMLVTLVAMRWVGGAAVVGVADPVQRDGLAAGLSVVFERFIMQTVVLALLGLIVATVAWLVGPSASAVGVRGVFSGSATGASAGSWLVRHARGLQLAAAGLGFAFLLLTPATGLLPVVGTVVVVGAAIAILQRVATN